MVKIMLSCKDVAKLVSESMDRSIPLRRRMMIKMHILMCSMCRRYVREMKLIMKTVKSVYTPGFFAEARLSESGVARIKKILEMHYKKELYEKD